MNQIPPPLMPPWLSPVASRILAIDPGTDQSGFVHVICHDFEITRLLSADKVPNGKMREHIRWFLQIQEIPGEVVIEQPSGGKFAGKTLMTTAWEAGRFYETAFPRATCYYRQSIKTSIGPKGKKNDADIIAHLTAKFGPKGTPKNPGPTYMLFADCWQALAAAVHHNRIQRELFIKRNA